MTITVTSKGQVTLPADARRRLGIRTGTRLMVVVTGEDRMEIVKLGTSLKDLRSILPRPKRRMSLKQMDDAIARGAMESMR